MTKPKMNFFLLTITGQVTADSIDSTTQLHNQTAGDPGGVAAAKSLGDVSHMTFMPVDAATNFNGQLLFMDIWNNLEGLNMFFSDPQVQAGGKMMFASREPAVWTKLDNFVNFQFPAPTGKNERVVGLVRGKVKSFAEAAEIHNAAIEPQVLAARAAGIVSHEFYAKVAAPGSPESLEVLGVDVWMNGESMMQHYSSPTFQNSGLYKMFTAKPDSSAWKHPKGEWVEW